MLAIEIHPITAEETIPLRWAILRAGLLRETSIFPNDEADTSRHFGAFADGELVGVATIHRAPMPGAPDPTAYQVRGMATVEKVRGAGAGGLLLAACLEEAQHAGASQIWCNARSPAAGFYEKHGFVRLGDVFEIPTAGPHYQMARSL
jgi:predicted GNAT family N-acyltransferase